MERIAGEARTSKADVLRSALALAKAAHDARRRGLHLGLAEDPSRLDAEIVGLPWARGGGPRVDTARAPGR